MSNSQSVVTEWDTEYAKVARLAAASAASQGEEDNVQRSISTLETTLDNLPLSGPEVNRRKQLLHHLKSKISSSSNSSPGRYQPPGSSSSSAAVTGEGGQQQQQTTMQRAIAHQDSMIDQLSVGVGRLRDQSEAIGDEARLHVGLLNDMDSNLDVAQDSLASEARRAARLRNDQSLWKLQLTVAGLTILFFVLLLLGS
eukprot:CAMPEP_0113498286 /NCGR_PEP_ID=MMETSP0014_2-20120614/31081_1 /TAXON_ID=2857 /ORGANISM="Nitzschia sp." /LENGTH=197 /DNA_ID=CAMNT_0000392279 /DNA_START=35 /DNA_END=628 /DNA_ORIENTATION=+ /assembly_acc=CAM_ASM_000159